MKLLRLPLTLLRFQYRIARVPFALIERRVVSRLDEEAPARLFYERSLGALDATVGGALGDRQLEDRGATLVERSETLGEAARLTDVADQTKEQADDELRRKRDRAADAPTEAHAESRERVEAARKDAEERKVEASRAAAKKTADAKQRADDAASRKIAAAEQTKKQADEAVTAIEQTHIAASNAQKKDAAEKRIDAVTKKSHADRVDALADVEKDKRKEARGNGS